MIVFLNKVYRWFETLATTTTTTTTTSTYGIVPPYHTGRKETDVFEVTFGVM